MKQGTIEYGIRVDRKTGKFNRVPGCDVISREYTIRIRLYDTDGFDGTKFNLENINPENINELEQAVFREMMKDSTLRSRRLSEVQELPFDNLEDDSADKHNQQKLF